MPERNDEFDGYRKWLGIANKKRPPTHYELLAISLDEDDSEVIRAAAEQRRHYVETKRGDGHDSAVNEILYRIGEAEATLLNDEMRRDYDRQLNLFEKRRKNRQVDPFPSPSRVKSRPGRTVGEDAGIVKTFAGIMAIICVGFGLMAWFSFNHLWKKADVAQAAPVQRTLEPNVEEANEQVGQSAVAVTSPSPIETPQPTVAVVVPTRDSVPPTDQATPPSGSTTFQGHHYKVYRETMGWNEAKDRCEAMGGHLVTIGSEAENTFVKALATETIGDITNTGVWLGASDEREEGRWEWVDGSPFSYTAWYGEQPNNGGLGEDFLFLLLHFRGPAGKEIRGWCDQPNDSKIHVAYFVCEWDSPQASGMELQARKQSAVDEADKKVMDGRRELPKPLLQLTFDANQTAEVHPELHGAKFVKGKVGNAMQFDGKSYASVNFALPVGNAPRSLAVWIKDARGPLEKRLIHPITQGHKSGATFGIMQASGKWRFFDFNGGLDSGQPVDLEWHHHCVTSDGSMITYYFDGMRSAEVKRALNTAVAPLMLGTFGDDLDAEKRFVGLIDEVKIFDLALSAEQVRTVMSPTAVPEPVTRTSQAALNVDPVASEPVAHWKFWDVFGKGAKKDSLIVSRDGMLLSPAHEQAFCLTSAKEFSGLDLKLEFQFQTADGLANPYVGIVSTLPKPAASDWKQQIPRSIQIKLDPKVAGELVLPTADFKVKLNEVQKIYNARHIAPINKAEVKLREWNTLEVKCSEDSKLIVKINGVTVNRLEGMQTNKGHVVIWPANAEMRLRNAAVVVDDNETKMSFETLE